MITIYWILQNKGNPPVIYCTAIIEGAKSIDMVIICLNYLIPATFLEPYYKHNYADLQVFLPTQGAVLGK